jgi:alkanesulfonate monooxygenase SsuD/methylene tetrahydromethanopterin reductase-like flavin-dependent oxidoreductase (luciferase family)
VLIIAKLIVLCRCIGAISQPHIPLLGGGGGEQVTLKLVAQYGDACNVGHLDNEGFAHKFDGLKQHCKNVGRDYNEIRRTVLLNCAIAEKDDEAMKKAEVFRRNIPSGRIREQALVGTPAIIRQRSQEIEQLGAQEVMLYMPDARGLESVRLFAGECIKR